MSAHATEIAEGRQAFTEDDLAYLPGGFPPSVIRDGRIVRADGLPLGLHDYDLLGEDFPAILTATGELAMSPRPGPDHEDAREHLVGILNQYLRCHPGGKVSSGTELRIPQRDRPLAPDVMFFSKHAEWPKSHINQLPDLAVEIISPSNTDAEWDAKLDFYQQGFVAEVWFNHLDGSVEIWKGSPRSSTMVQPGEFLSSPLFPGLAIDPAWIRKYPEEELSLIRKFMPRIRVLDDPEDPELTKRARQLAARITRHLKVVGREDLVPSSEEFLSQLRQSAEDEPGDLPSQSHGLKP